MGERDAGEALAHVTRFILALRGQSDVRVASVFRRPGREEELIRQIHLQATHRLIIYGFPPPPILDLRQVFAGCRDVTRIA
jgi:hypothetical protein